MMVGVAASHQVARSDLRGYRRQRGAAAIVAVVLHDLYAECE